jgi:hypothetical protein
VIAGQDNSRRGGGDDVDDGVDDEVRRVYRAASMTTR